MTRKVIFKYSLLYLIALILICSYVLNHSATNDVNITQALNPILVVHNEFDLRARHVERVEHVHFATANVRGHVPESRGSVEREVA